MMKHVPENEQIGSEIYDPQQEPVSREKEGHLLFELIEKRKNECRNGYESSCPHILFLLRGSIRITDRHHNSKYLSSNQCVFLPKNEPVDIFILEDVRFIFLLFSRHTFLGNKNEFNVRAIGSIAPCIHPVMEITPLIANFLDNMLRFNELFYNANYQRIKAEEVHEIARNCYSDRQRAWFCQSIIRPADDFKAFVEANCDRVSKVSELAELTGMCETTFRLKFQEIFGETTYAWMMKQKAIKMNDLILSGESNIKSLMLALKFVHKSSFIRFCHRYMGGSPSEVVLRISKKEANFQQIE